VLSKKPSSRYRVGPEGFAEAERNLLAPEKRSQQSIAEMLPAKKQRREIQEAATPKASVASTASPRQKASNTLFQYFHVQRTPKISDRPLNTIG